jgi:glutamine amidotransferase
MIAIIDVTGHNLSSIGNALARLNIAYEMTHSIDKIKAASHIILPGVGTARHAMNALREHGLVELLQQTKQPILGICLGMQLLLEKSEEGGEIDCLGLIPGRIAPLSSVAGYPVPHMGWNRLHWEGKPAMMKDIKQGDYVYFVHSYALISLDFAVARCQYSEPFTAIVQRKNVYGMQFHPEKSGSVGLQLLKNFSEIVVPVCF